MALIKCPQCGNQICEMANECPCCGYFLRDSLSSGLVHIKIPSNLVQWIFRLAEIFRLAARSRGALITADGRHLWEGQHGESAIFTIAGPTQVTIFLGSWVNPVEGVVYPDRKYTLTQVEVDDILPTFCLTEVGVIDAD